jgi:tRNA nucleotidyltransferase (CCA-adding enzyme)
VKRIYGKFYELATSLSITPRVLAMKTWLDNSADTDDAIWGKLKRTRDGLLSWMAEETTAVLEEQKKSHKKEKKNKK